MKPGLRSSPTEVRPPRPWPTGCDSDFPRSSSRDATPPTCVRSYQRAAWSDPASASCRSPSRTPARTSRAAMRSDASRRGSPTFRRSSGGRAGRRSSNLTDGRARTSRERSNASSGTCPSCRASRAQSAGVRRGRIPFEAWVSTSASRCSWRPIGAGRSGSRAGNGARTSAIHRVLRGSVDAATCCASAARRDRAMPNCSATISSGLARANRRARAGVAFTARGDHCRKALSAARKLGFCVLAGPSAVEGPEPRSAATMVYVDQPALAAIVGLGASSRRHHSPLGVWIRLRAACFAGHERFGLARHQPSRHLPRPGVDRSGQSLHRRRVGLDGALDVT